ncbi:hypothetical protein BRADI_1g35493v3 [Brachypodium distachyon]|uniref:Uncharacterized protein n=1 Tax=Brachypodium distachyon TaxID=15368 RepID=A0A0Q3H429_BRADI|nr:hypothetical protein BRADI_1g35493v3 [Brachypodium distachyon]
MSFFLASSHGRLLRDISRNRHPLLGGYTAYFRRFKAHLLLDGIEDAADNMGEAKNKSR